MGLDLKMIARLQKGLIRPASMSDMISAAGRLKAAITHWFAESFLLDKAI